MLRHNCTRAEVLLGLRALLGLPNFKPKSLEVLCQNIKWYVAEMDFGDALHLALSGGDEAFVSFNKALEKIAALNDTSPAVQVMRRSAK